MFLHGRKSNMLTTKKRGRPRKMITAASSGKGGFGFFELKCKYCDDTALVSEGTKQRICALCVVKQQGWRPIEQIENIKK